MTGLLFCTRCKAKVRADSIEDGRYKLDHSIGLYLGKPCSDRSNCDGINPLLRFKEDIPEDDSEDISELTLKKINNKKKVTKSKSK